MMLVSGRCRPRGRFEYITAKRVLHLQDGIKAMVPRDRFECITARRVLHL
jgi:hypothetical protein